jgi:DNA invertase Pin-like site-specific DNA recombinase
VADEGKRVEVVGYMRTSSATNVGDGKDSEARQRKAIEGYAKVSGAVIVDWFYDAAVSGADPIEARPGFAELLARIAGNGVRTVIVETANRFARDLMVQEVGYAMLRSLGVTLVAADSPSSFLDDGPTSNLIRQILGAVSEFDKAMTVTKLKGARDRVRRAAALTLFVTLTPRELCKFSVPDDLNLSLFATRATYSDADIRLKLPRARLPKP